MPDYGQSVWQLDESTGAIARDANLLRDGTYFDFKVPEPGEPAGFVPDPTFSHITRRVHSVPEGTFGAGFKALLTGYPWWDSRYAVSSGFQVPIDAFGYGNMYERQPFTIFAKVRYTEPTPYDTPWYTTELPGTLVSAGNAWGISIRSMGLTFRRGNGVQLDAPLLASASVEKSPGFPDWNKITDKDHARIGSGFTSGINDQRPPYLGVPGQVWRYPYRQGIWMDLGFRYDGLRKSIWVDGVRIKEDPDPDTANCGPSEGTMRFNWQVSLEMANVALYHKALSDSEMG